MPLFFRFSHNGPVLVQVSNGITTRLISIQEQGIYSLKAYDKNGCFSTDSIKILNVFSNPVVHLNMDSLLCQGSVRMLDAGVGFTSYLWIDASSSRLIEIHDLGKFRLESLFPFNTYLWSTAGNAKGVEITTPGTYWLQVTDSNNCVAKEFVQVMKKTAGKLFIFQPPLHPTITVLTIITGQIVTKPRRAEYCAYLRHPLQQIPPPIRYLKKHAPGLKNYPFLLILTVLIISHSFADAQPITGFWKGKIDRRNVELKIIKNGDSLTGTSYYYESPNSYSRWSIKGYFDDRDNSVVWWDDQLIEQKKTKRLFSSSSPTPYLSNADFNCPGGTKMYLNGNTALKEKEEQPRGPFDLEKSNAHIFTDEWDFVIDNYTIGGNDPELIDSIGRMAFNKPLPVEPELVRKPQKPSEEEEVVVQPKKKIFIPEPKKEWVAKPGPEPGKAPVIAAVPLTNRQKFSTRRKVIQQEIAIKSDSIELTFYDNAEVDGDSIAIFLNDHLLYEHVRLTDKAYTIKLAVIDLQNSNELVMVAENLGSIPPNTSLMVAMVDGKRYETRLESTEQSSAAIRFVRNKPPTQ